MKAKGETATTRKPPNRKPTAAELRMIELSRVVKRGDASEINRVFGVELGLARAGALEELVRLASWVVDETDAKRLQAAADAIARVRARFAPKASARK